MGAIGVALIAREREQANRGSTFIGWDALESFSYSQETNLICPFCSNRCNRTRITFSNGTSWITGNRCTKGEIVGELSDTKVREQVREANRTMESVPNLYNEREQLLFKDWPCTPVMPSQEITLGIPRVLFFWDSMPFWKTLLQAAGLHRKALPQINTRHLRKRPFRRYIRHRMLPRETGSWSSSRPAQTGCRPHFHANRYHGTLGKHLKGQPVNVRCGQGYALVVQNSHNPSRRWDIPFDNPMFHWFTEEDCAAQLMKYFKETFQIPEKATLAALDQARNAQASFSAALQQRGAEVLAQARNEGTYAVVLAGRPYHNDDLVNHELPTLFTEHGIPVITADSVPGATQVPASKQPDRYRKQLPCPHAFNGNPGSAKPQHGICADSKLRLRPRCVSTDEIIRLMKEISDKTPLVLKVDESDIRGPLGIRVRSFIETVNERREKEKAAASTQTAHAIDADQQRNLDAPCCGSAQTCESSQCAACTAAFERKIDEALARATGEKLADPYPQKFTKEDAATKTVLVPNTSHAFSQLMAAAFANQGLTTVSLPIGRERAIYLGKRYVHNDICFPAQIVIGEALAALESGEYDPDQGCHCHWQVHWRLPPYPLRCAAA